MFGIHLAHTNKTDLLNSCNPNHAAYHKSKTKKNLQRKKINTFTEVDIETELKLI